MSTVDTSLDIDVPLGMSRQLSRGTIADTHIEKHTIVLFRPQNAAENFFCNQFTYHYCSFDFFLPSHNTEDAEKVCFT